MMTNDVVASAYLIVRASRYPYGPTNTETGLKRVDSAKIVMARQNRPSKLETDEVLVKVTVQLPASVFDPITPSALIVIPEELVLARHEVEVEATEETN